MASFSHTVAIPRPPSDVFPWLLEPDKVGRWTSGLETYEVIGGGPVRQGARIHEVLSVSDRRIDVELQVTRYAPPDSAESRFSTNGIDVVSAYRVAAAPGGAEVTQSLEAKATSFAARLLLPVVQPRLERKLTEDLERLRQVLASAA